uniref:Transcription factor S-II n=1 Tax=Pithovirus LCPAC403 TaxID=2506596 RepID=A0A481ZD88_9VIRU|nr:MAG: transcription factor S-II [Pithovirus LCPAC403]
MISLLHLKQLFGDSAIIDVIIQNNEFRKPQWVYELKYMYDEMGECDTLKHIDITKSPKDIFMNSPLMNIYNLHIMRERFATTVKDAVVEGIFRCINKDCKSMRTTASSKQTRRADEAATITIVCSECKTTWKI